MVGDNENRIDFFKRFVESLESWSSRYAEDYDIESLLALYGEEREKAIDLLIQRLGETTDPRAPRALGYMESHRAVPSLEEALNSGVGLKAIESANSLWRITGDESYIISMSKILVAGDKYARTMAANYLSKFRGEEVDEVLMTALFDEDEYVRANAFESLITIHDMREWDLLSGHGFGLLSFRLSISYKSVRIKAAEDIVRIIKAKRGGKTAVELGLTLTYVERTPEADRLVRSYRAFPGKAPWEEDYDLEALSLLQGEEALWGESVIIDKLQKGDFRAVRALVYIKSEMAIEVFRECIVEAEGRMDVELVWALWKLAGDKSFKLRLVPYLKSSDAELKKRAQEVFGLLS